MSTRRLRVWRTRKAREDLIEIWTFVAAENLVAADALLDLIEGKCLLLAANPNLGPSRDDIRHGLRYLLAGKYMILYRLVEGGVEIVRVVHGRRDLFALL